MQRLDTALHHRRLTQSRSQAENYIKLGLVRVNGKVASKASQQVGDNDNILLLGDQYVSRAAEKLASVSSELGIRYEGKTVLDVGSSTGGFTEYAINHGANKVIAVDVGTDQMHAKLRVNPKVELYEKTDIREFQTKQHIDLVMADVSFISLTYILPHVKTLLQQDSLLCIMCKPQFEAGKDQINKGVIKNSAMRRDILKQFESWLDENGFIILDKADSKVAGVKGNVERFYKLKLA